MTVLVGVKCTDGIVIGCDSIATSSDGQRSVMQIKANSKLNLYDGGLIFATTGSVGLAQRCDVHIRKAVEGNVFKNLASTEAATNLSSRLLKDIAASSMHVFPHQGIGFGGLMAAVIKGEPYLVEYDAQKFQPEFKFGEIFYASMGSGQSLADPFLAFVSRVLWKNTLPDVRMGKFGLYWALSHTLSLAPGMVGPPIRLATLAKSGQTWVAAEAADLNESAEFIARLEEAIGTGAIINPTGGVEPASTMPQAPKRES